MPNSVFKRISFPDPCARSPPRRARPLPPQSEPEAAGRDDARCAEEGVAPKFAESIFRAPAQEGRGGAAPPPWVPGTEFGKELGLA